MIQAKPKFYVPSYESSWGKGKVLKIQSEQPKVAQNSHYAIFLPLNSDLALRHMPQFSYGTNDGFIFIPLALKVSEFMSHNE